MASKLSPATPRSKLQRGSGLEMDRGSPTAKNAAGMLGENTPKKRTPVSRGAELNQVQEELAKIKEQLSLTEKSKSNLLQDLARSKRQVEDLTAKLQDAAKVSQQNRQRVEEMEHASFTAAEDWQVEVEVLKQQHEEAVLELQASKQSLESLRHELVVCVEAKNEAVRLAGEAMNAAESTAKRVEELSAELLAIKRANVVSLDSASTQAEKSSPPECDEDADKEVELEKAQQEICSARSELGIVKQSLAVAQESERQVMELKLMTEHLQKDLEISKGAEIESAMQLCSLSSELKQAKFELADFKEIERRLELEISDLNGALEKSKLELVTLKQSEEAASVAAANACIKYEELVADVERLREMQAKTHASLEAMSAELMEAQEKLAEATIEGLTLETFLESLKEELDVDQAQFTILQEKEASANAKAEALASQLMTVTEANQKEILYLNEALSYSRATMESIQLESERQRSQLVTLQKLESLANEKVEAHSAELKRAHAELEESKRQELASSEKAISLSRELVITQKELSAMKEREISMVSKFSSMMGDLEEKQGEVLELRRKVTSSDGEAAALRTKLDEAHEEVAHLKEREYGMHSKAAALSVVLASLSEETERRVTDLTRNKEVAMAKAAALSDELEKARLDLEDALTAANAARGDADKLQEYLELAILEKEQACQGEEVARGEATKSKEGLVVALAKAQRAEEELKRALEAVEEAEQKVLEHAQEAVSLKELLHAAQSDVSLAKEETAAVRNDLHAALLDSQNLAAEQKVLEHTQEATSLKELLHAAESDVRLAKQETEEVRHGLHTALLDSQNLMKELVQERESAQDAKEEIVSLKREALMMNEQAKAASEEAEAKLGKLKEELDRMKSEEEKAQVACKSADTKLQEVLMELEALKLKSLPVQDDDEEKSKEQQEGASTDVSWEEITDLNTKLQETELQLANAMAQLEASSTHAESLSKELQAARMEKEEREKAVLEVHQLLADTEKAKSNMEAEIQRLLDDSKQRQSAKDAIDIPVHSEATVRALCLECREDKPQPELVEEALDSASTLHKVFENQKSEVVMWCPATEGNNELGHSEELPRLSLQKEDSLEYEEGSVKDEGAIQDEAVSLPAKKKKKNLLGRLGTLLEKKKHSQQQTP